MRYAMSINRRWVGGMLAAELVACERQWRRTNVAAAAVCAGAAAARAESRLTKTRRANPPKRNENYTGANKKIRGKTWNFVPHKNRGASQ